MCRNIKSLYNFDPPATNKEVRAASLQFVRKVSGFHEPSTVNKEVFERSIDEIAKATKQLLDSLVTHAHPHNRELEAAKAHSRALQRFGSM